MSDKLYTREDVLKVIEAAAQCCTDELRNTSMLLSHPPQSSAAWGARNAIRRIDIDKVINCKGALND